MEEYGKTQYNPTILNIVQCINHVRYFKQVLGVIHALHTLIL